MPFDPITDIQDFKTLGEFGDVNPSITDSSTYSFSSPANMKQIFETEIEGCFLYSRHFNPINKYLCRALATLEATEAAQVAASGMAAITSSILQLCGTGDELVSSWTIYGGSYAFLRNFLPRFGIKVAFVDITNLDMVRSAITERTRVIYCESISNPLLEIPDLPALAKLARQHNLTLIVDNTFSPLILSPTRHGAHVVVHSLTKFINGTSDCVAGAICSSKEFVGKVTDINAGACMLLGPVMDSLRSASILKNIHTLHLRIRQHSANALFLASHLNALGIKVHYPGLPKHPQHELMKRLMNPGYGFGGMLVMDVENAETAELLMSAMQEANVGYLAVSLGYFKTLFSAPASSTSSEIPVETQKQMGLSSGMIRLSVGLDNNIQLTAERITDCLKKLKLA